MPAVFIHVELLNYMNAFFFSPPLFFDFFLNSAIRALRQMLKN